MAEKPTYKELEQRIKELEKEAAEHKQAKEVLKETEQKYQHLTESLLDTVYEFDRKGRFTYVNEAGTHMFGYSKEEILNGLRVQDTMVERDRDLSQRAISEIFKGNTTVGERTFLRKDGTQFIGEIHSGPIYKGEEMVGVRGVLRDITTSKQVEEALRKSEKKYRDLVENISDVIYFTNKNGVMTYISPAIESVLGYSPSEIIGKPFTEFIYEEDLPRMKKRFEEILSGLIKPSEYRLLNKSGEIRWISASSKPVFRENQVIGIQGVLTDITEHKRADDALHREKEKFRVLVEGSPLGVLLIGDDGRYEYINPKFIEIFGYTLEDVPTGREWFRKAYPDQQYRNQVISTWISDLKKIEIWEARSRIFTVMCKDGSEKVINFRSVAMETGEQLVIYEDITEKNRLEAQLQQAHKMEAIGTLAGGIAHDFNNLLMGILGSTSLMLFNIKSNHPHYESLKNVEQHVQSGAKLTKQLLGIAKGGKYEVKPTDLNKLLEKTSEMFSRTSKDIRVYTKYQTDIWPVEVDQSQIEQVLLNLYVNAWQAMPNGGDLYLQSENVFLDEEHVKLLSLKPGRCVRLTITDTGVGMDEATIQRIFDPFFTTKEMRRGTGLGLASVYGIIRNHDGIIGVFSKKGEGATFTIYLAASDKQIIEENEMPREVLKGIEMVLLVDDEDSIIDVGEKILHMMGYQVLSARSGKEAVELYQKNQATIDMVVLDMIMPEMGGEETYDKLKEINPQVKVLLSSGYSIDGKAKEILEKGCDGFIQKPFTMEELSQKIREILDKK